MTMMRFKIVVVLLCAIAWPVTAQLPAPTFDGEDQPYFRNQPDSGKYFFIITGAAASEDIKARFRQWSLSLYDTLNSEYGYAASNLILLLDDGNIPEREAARLSGGSEIESITEHMQLLRSKVKEGDQVTFFLIGHGSSLGNNAKFNIVGPDITGEEFAAMLSDFQQQDVVVINTTSASFEFSRALSAPGRVIVSATRSAAERFDPMFAQFFIEALQSRNGDRDKNNRVSVIEAFTYARLGVDEWYKLQERLPTEHAVLDDNGDGLFSMEPAPTLADGRLAEIAYIDVASAGVQKQSPQAARLLAEIQDLERSVFILRGQKENYLEEDYWNRMEALLIDLARKTGSYNELP